MCLEKIKVNYELLAFGMQVLGLLFRLNWDLLFNFLFFFLPTNLLLEIAL